jgi:Zn finger protein HypA/HybF involved in hydrogenase expression
MVLDMWMKRSPRRHARYTMEIDRVKLGCSKGSKVNSESMEDTHQICCSKCHKADNNRRRYEENVRT